MRLNADDRAQLQAAMIDGFKWPTLHEAVLLTERRLDIIASERADYGEVVDTVIEYAQLYDWIPELIAALKTENPTNRLVSALPPYFLDRGTRYSEIQLQQAHAAPHGHPDQGPAPGEGYQPPHIRANDWPEPHQPYEDINETRIRSQKDSKEMVLVTGGDFEFGPNRDTYHLGSFWIDKTVVTNREYKYFIDDTVAHPVPANWDKKRRLYPEGKAKFPVVFVNWHDAMAYAAWAGKHLPTEQQWEKAARGIHGYTFPWGNEWSDRRCNTVESGVHHTSHVGRYSPAGDSPYGCVDMSGNVWEWTATRDNKHDRAYVLRGGSWYSDRSDAHVTARIVHNPLAWYPVVGFRLVDRPPELPLPLINYLLKSRNA